MQVGFGSLNTFSGSYRSNAALADILPPRRATPALAAAEPAAASANKSSDHRVGQSLPIAEARAGLGADTAAFATAAGKMLQDVGASLPPEVMLAIGSDGRVSVVNSRADAARIEQQFDNSPELRSQFTALAAKAGLVRAADSNPDFSANYQQLAGNPTAQRALAEHAVAAGGVRFHVVLTPQGPEVFFAGAGVAKA